MRRISGILLHISSLPNRWGIGTLGPEARAFVDILQETGQQVWQILPLGPPGLGNSPYHSYSAFAGNMLLISPDQLAEDGLVQPEDLEVLPAFPAGKAAYTEVLSSRTVLLRKAWIGFKRSPGRWEKAYTDFLYEQNGWLTDYCLFRVLKSRDESLCWNQWEEPLRCRDASALKVASIAYREEIEFQRFIQFIFFRQWFLLKEYARGSGVMMLGDMPLYVALDSADVWVNPDLFRLDGQGRMLYSGGVPPDLFSEDGQLWSCPVYDWDRMARRDFDWWQARMHFNFRLYDRVRLDHFRGLVAYWAVPAGAGTAVEGKWVKARGGELLERLFSRSGELPLVAEDLGLISPEVEILRKRFGLPGMKVLQFAWDGDPGNPYLPHNYRRNFVVYTGTHDNDTMLGWLNKISAAERTVLSRYFGKNPNIWHRKLIEAAWASVAFLAIMPMQDLLELDGSARMNLPGIPEGNWEWRFEWTMLKPRHKTFLIELGRKYNRISEPLR